MEIPDSPTAITALDSEYSEIHTFYNGETTYHSTIEEAYVEVINNDFAHLSWVDSMGVQQIWKLAYKGVFPSDAGFQAFLNGLSQNFRDSAYNSAWWYLQVGDEIVEVTTDASFFSRFCH